MSGSTAFVSSPSGSPCEVPDRLGRRRPVPRCRPDRHSPPTLGACARASRWGPPARRPACPVPGTKRHAPALLPALARPGRASGPHPALHGPLPVPRGRPAVEFAADLPPPGPALHRALALRPPCRIQPARPPLLPGRRSRRLRARAPPHARRGRRRRRRDRLRAASGSARPAVRRPPGGVRDGPRACDAVGPRRGARTPTGCRRRGWRVRLPGARDAGASVHLPDGRTRRRPRRDTRVARTIPEVGVGAARRIRAARGGRRRLGLHAPGGLRRWLDRRRRTTDRRGPPLLSRAGRARATRHVRGTRALPRSRSSASRPVHAPETVPCGFSTG